jgi:hypothetical protein
VFPQLLKVKCLYIFNPPFEAIQSEILKTSLNKQQITGNKNKYTIDIT